MSPELLSFVARMAPPKLRPAPAPAPAAFITEAYVPNPATARVKLNTLVQPLYDRDFRLRLGTKARLKDAAKGRAARERKAKVLADEASKPQRLLEAKRAAARASTAPILIFSHVSATEEELYHEDYIEYVLDKELFCYQYSCSIC